MFFPCCRRQRVAEAEAALAGSRGELAAAAAALQAAAAEAGGLLAGAERPHGGTAAALPEPC